MEPDRRVISHYRKQVKSKTLIITKRVGGGKQISVAVRALTADELSDQQGHIERYDTAVAKRQADRLADEVLQKLVEKGDTRDKVLKKLKKKGRAHEEVQKKLVKKATRTMRFCSRTIPD